jgi:hypothetical protein
MFKRRKPLSLLENLAQFFWPSMGWMRSFHYARHRLVRVADTTHKIALGLAIGAAVSFTPLVGTHFIQAGLLAYVLRGNVFSAMIGTFVGNPWTFPFLWWAGFSFGGYLFGALGFEGASELPAEITLAAVWELIKTQPMSLFLPWMLGGYLLAGLAVLSFYFPFFFLVRTAKAARMKVRMRKADKIAHEVTGQPD